mgnify:CR=1 FL=1
MAKIETLKLPKNVIDYESYGTDKQEREYVSPAEVSKVSIEKIKKYNLERGHKIFNIFTKNEKLAA